MGAVLWHEASPVARTMKPLHKHDCERCKFIATIVGDGVIYDAWVHPDPHPINQSVILRFGSNGPDYTSSPAAIIDTAPDTPAQALGVEGIDAAFSATRILMQWTLAQARKHGIVPDPLKGTA